MLRPTWACLELNRVDQAQTYQETLELSLTMHIKLKLVSNASQTLSNILSATCMRPLRSTTMNGWEMTLKIKHNWIWGGADLWHLSVKKYGHG